MPPTPRTRLAFYLPRLTKAKSFVPPPSTDLAADLATCAVLYITRALRSPGCDQGCPLALARLSPGTRSLRRTRRHHAPGSLAIASGLRSGPLTSRLEPDGARGVGHGAVGRFRFQTGRHQMSPKIKRCSAKSSSPLRAPRPLAPASDLRGPRSVRAYVRVVGVGSSLLKGMLY